jgi:hypothetical protein
MDSESLEAFNFSSIIASYVAKRPWTSVVLSSVLDIGCIVALAMGVPD